LREQKRYAVADAAMDEIEKHDDPRHLSEPLPDPTGSGFSRPPAE
jgi:hypothetical protein